MTDRRPELLVLGPDAEPGAVAERMTEVVAAAGPALSAQVVVWHGGPLLPALRAEAPVGVVAELPGRGPGALVEKALVRGRRASAAHAVRRRRLGLPAWGRLPPDAVLVAGPGAAPLLRYLPESPGVPVSVLVPAGELTDANHAPVSDADLDLLLARADRFLVETDDSWDHLVGHLRVDPARLVAVGDPRVDDAPEPPSDERLTGWRERLGIRAGQPIVVGSGPLVWAGGADLFVRAAWMIRERLGHDAAFVWVGAAGEELELSQLRHDISHMGLADHVHLLLGPDDGEALWLGDVHVVTSRVPEAADLHVPGAARGQAIVAWEAPLLRRFTRDDAARTVAFLDMAGLAGAIGDLLGDEGARRELGARASARYRDWHVRPAHAAALVRLLQERP